MYYIYMKYICIQINAINFDVCLYNNNAHLHGYIIAASSDAV